jgi:putative ABC transport system ATP-binding protein
MTAAAVAIQDLTVRYTRGGYAVTPIDRLSIDIEPGQLVLLLGPSGCGKTTLLSCLAGIQKPSDGTILVDGKDVTAMNGSTLTEYRRHGVGVVFQAFNLIPSLSALDNVAMPMRSAGVKGRLAHERAAALLTEVGLADRLDHRPANLSGGQQQRVAIARALALEPRLVVADEPTANLDHRQVETVLRLLRGLTSRGHTVVVSTHDHRLLPLADRVVDLAAPAERHDDDHGRVVHLAKGAVLFREGHHGDEIFEVASGSIGLRHEGAGTSGETFATLHLGDCFGEMGALFQLPRSATAFALEDSALMARTVAEFRAVHGADRLRELVGRTIGANTAD